MSTCYLPVMLWWGKVGQGTEDQPVCTQTNYHLTRGKNSKFNLFMWPHSMAVAPHREETTNWESPPPPQWGGWERPPQGGGCITSSGPPQGGGYVTGSGPTQRGGYVTGSGPPQGGGYMHRYLFERSCPWTKIEAHQWTLKFHTNHRGQLFQRTASTRNDDCSLDKGLRLFLMATSHTHTQ